MIKIKNKETGSVTTLADENPIAAKIKDGYGYSFDEKGNVVASDEKETINFDSYKEKLDNGTITQSETNELLKFLISKINITY